MSDTDSASADSPKRPPDANSWGGLRDGGFGSGLDGARLAGELRDAALPCLRSCGVPDREPSSGKNSLAASSGEAHTMGGGGESTCAGMASAGEECTVEGVLASSPTPIWPWSPTWGECRGGGLEKLALRMRCGGPRDGDIWAPTMSARDDSRDKPRAALRLLRLLRRLASVRALMGASIPPL